MVAGALQSRYPKSQAFLKENKPKTTIFQPEIVTKLHTQNAQNANGQIGHSRFVFVRLVDHPIDADHDAILTPVHGLRTRAMYFPDDTILPKAIFLTWRHV